MKVKITMPGDILQNQVLQVVEQLPPNVVVVLTPAGNRWLYNSEEIEIQTEET